jgi:hypothetical protein
MQSKIIRSLIFVLAILLITMPACTPKATQAIPTKEAAPLIPVAGDIVTPTALPTTVPVTATVEITHVMIPTNPRGGKLVYDVESSGTAPEQRAPYGDSYDINRLERPFTQEMAYLPALDIVTFTVAKDNDWWYVTLELAGVEPNNMQDINYGVELDLDHDGYGDYLVWARPPYTDQWETLAVQIYQDQNHNTGGYSAGKSDAPFSADGYETVIFDGSLGGSDPDMAWVHIDTSLEAAIQFAFKRSWSGDVFMLGVIADAGLRDPRMLDYVDRFPLPEAGSPVKESQYYPLGQLVLVDNTCREAFGFEPSRYELQICPIPVAPTKTPSPSEPGIPLACPDPGPNVCRLWDSVNCVCLRK